MHNAVVTNEKLFQRIIYHSLYTYSSFSFSRPFNLSLSLFISLCLSLSVCVSLGLRYLISLSVNLTSNWSQEEDNIQHCHHWHFSRHGFTTTNAEKIYYLRNGVVKKKDKDIQEILNPPLPAFELQWLWKECLSIPIQIWVDISTK